jgi:DNA-binding transcriptional LysR family regulator
MRNDFDLADIDAFVAVCETGSMTDASKRLEITESAVSHIIRRLEARMGIALLDRSSRPLKTTVLGAQLLPRARQLLQDALAISYELRAKESFRFSNIVLGVVDTLDTWFSAQLVRRLASASPNWTIVSGTSAELWERFAAREFSALIVGDDDQIRSDASKTILMRESLVLVTPPFHIHAELNELAGKLPLISTDAASGIGRLVANYLARLKLDPTPAFTFPTIEAVLMMVAQGSGWAIVPSSAILKDSPVRDQVSISPLTSPSVSRRFSLVTRRSELGALPQMIETTARACFDEQIASVRQSHPKLFSKLKFSFDGQI